METLNNLFETREMTEDKFLRVLAAALLAGGLAVLASCGGSSSGVRGGGGGTVVTVLPATATVQGSMSRQFSAAVTGATSPGVVWSVGGIIGGSVFVGTISADGLFTAPNAVPDPATVTVTATSQSDPNVSGSASVTVTPSALTTLFALTPADGANPSGSLTFDAAGNLYGTASGGGSQNCVAYGYNGCGTVFELTPSGSGSWTPNVLYSFTGGSDGVGPTGDLVFDPLGKMYGITSAGGGSSNCASGGCGTVFSLTPNSNGTWTKTTVYSFNGLSDGVGPDGGLSIDSHGNLFGTTFFGGGTGCGCGTIFELSPTSSGGFTYTNLHVFSGPEDGADPSGNLIFDQQGNLYGTTTGNILSFGVAQAGTVYELTPVSGGAWNYNVLYNFTEGLGTYPAAGLVLDQQGNLYGTTFGGGAGFGTVFKLTPDPLGAWSQTVLYIFQGGTDGSGPYAAPVIDAAGNLFGTTAQGGGAVACDVGVLSPGCGTIFKLNPRSDGTWAESTPHIFTGGSDGTDPQSGLNIDLHGNIFGTAYLGGINYGVVFVFVPSSVAPMGQARNPS